MKTEVSLEDIEVLVDHYRSRLGAPFDLHAFPWLQERLSLFSRFLGFFGLTKKISWQKKYLFPALAEAAAPHLRRFCEGSWRAHEEWQLKKLFDFFGEHIGACRAIFSSSLQSFLMGPAPSFSHERGSLHIKSREAMWRRGETYAEYKKRLQESVQRSQRMPSDASARKAPSEELYVEVHLSKQTKEQLDLFLEKLQVFREKCIECSFQLEKDYTKVFPFRCEFESLIAALHEEKETLFSLLLDVENQIAKLSEMHVVADEERALLLVENTASLLRQFTDDFQGIEQRMEVYRRQIEEARSFFQKRLSSIARNIDHCLLLPATSVFKARQARIVRMAREKVKKFRESLVCGPGPGVPIVNLEEEILYLTKLAQDFYAEGVEVDRMRARLLSLEQQVKQKTEQESSHNKNILEGVLGEISALQRTLEVSPDRKAHMDKIVASLKDVGILFGGL